MGSAAVRWCDKCGRRDVEVEEVRIETKRSKRSTEFSRPWVDLCEVCKRYELERFASFTSGNGASS